MSRCRSDKRETNLQSWMLVPFMHGFELYVRAWWHNEINMLCNALTVSCVLRMLALIDRSQCFTPQYVRVG